MNLSIKKFKKLSPDAVLELVKCESSFEIAETEKRMFGLIDGKPENFFTEAAAKGDMLVRDIALDGERLYRIFYQIRGENLHVCVSMNLTNRVNESLWGDGVDELARKEGCKAITFSTARLGHIIVAQNWGAQITGVTMRKIL